MKVIQVVAFCVIAAAAAAAMLATTDSLMTPPRPTPLLYQPPLGLTHSQSQIVCQHLSP
jgi:hypothetical protein